MPMSKMRLLHRAGRKPARRPLSLPQAKAVRRIANKAINRKAEKKYFLRESDTTADSNGSITDHCPIPLGDTDQTLGS